nr:MAG TPA: hypothetical protein [Caudoviricetes sp.]
MTPPHHLTYHRIIVYYSARVVTDRFFTTSLIRR